MFRRFGLLVIGCVVVAAFVACSAGGGSSDPANVSACTIKYDANGATSGTVPVDNNTYAMGDKAIILSNSGNLTLFGYRFAGWSPYQSSSVMYQPNETITFDRLTIVMYAIWTTVPDLKITYKYPDGASGGEYVYTNHYRPGDSFSLDELRSRVVVPTNYAFCGWSTNSDGSGTVYWPHVTYKFGDTDITVHARIYPSSSCVSIIYDGNGNTSGTVPTLPWKYRSGDVANIYPNYYFYGVSKNGMYISAWNTKADGTGMTYKYDDTVLVGSTDIRLYAVWSPYTTGGTGGTGGSGGTGGTTTHTYADVGDAEFALAKGMVAGTGVTSTSSTAYTSQTNTSSSLTVVYHLNGYTYNGLTLNGSITSVVSTSPVYTSTEGTVNVSGGSVTKIVYDYGSTGSTSITGTRKYTFTDGSTWTYDIATGSFTKN